MDTSTGRTDTELIQAYAASQDDAAFGELTLRYQRMVYHACLRMLGNADDAQDASQAVFLVLTKKAAQLTREGSLAGWLLDVSRKVSLEAIRRRTSQHNQESEAILWQEALADGTPVDYEPALRILDEELARLSPKLRQAVVLRYLQGNSEKAAAEQAGCPQGTLSRRTSDGLARLRQRFARRGVVLGGVALVSLLESQAQAAVPETLLPSILAAVKTVATGAATTAASTTTALMLAKGAMKAMAIAKVKLVAGVIGAAVVLTGVPVLVMTTRAAAPIVVTNAVASVESTNAFRFGQVLAQMAMLCREMKGPSGGKDNAQLQALVNEMQQLSKQPELEYPTGQVWRDSILGFAREAGGGPISPELDATIMVLCSNLCSTIAQQQGGNNENGFTLEPGKGLVMKASAPVVSMFTNIIGRLPAADRERIGMIRFEIAK